MLRGANIVQRGASSWTWTVKEAEAPQHEAEQEEARCKHELEMKKLEVKLANSTRAPSHNCSLASAEHSNSERLLKRPAFKDAQDELDSYLFCFEIFLKNKKWVKL